MIIRKVLRKKIRLNKGLARLILIIDNNRFTREFIRQKLKTVIYPDFVIFYREQLPDVLEKGEKLKETYEEWTGKRYYTSVARVIRYGEMTYDENMKKSGARI